VTKESLPDKIRKNNKLLSPPKQHSMKEKKNWQNICILNVGVKKNIGHVHASAVLSSVEFVGSHWLRRLNGFASQYERVYGKERNLTLLGMKLTHPARTCLLHLLCTHSSIMSSFGRKVTF
jgi:hypothetical protein